MILIPYGSHDLTEADIEAVVEVLRSDFLTQGAMVPIFEKRVLQHCGANHAVAVNSATSALHIALMALGVGPGDIVWSTPITFVASANAALYCGAAVDFVDIDIASYNMSVAALERKLEAAERIGLLPKVVIPVHLAGHSSDMIGISALAKRYGFKVLEDASHAIGGQYRQHPVGCCGFSDIAVFSFHPVKIITTGEGGMAVTNDSDLAHKMRLFRSHGITRNPEEMTKKIDGPWYYEQIELGYNYRMTDIQAALGVSQLERLSAFVEQRNRLADRYTNELKNTALILPKNDDQVYSAYHLYIVRVDLDESHTGTHLQIFNFMRENDIGVNLHYIPVYRQPYYQNMNFSFGDFPNAEEYYKSALSIPLFPKMTYASQTRVIEALYSALNK